MTMTTAADFAQQLKDQFGELISEPAEFRGEITVNVVDADRITEVCAFAKDELGFDYLIDISSLDHYGDCLLYTSPSPRDKRQSRMPSSA